MRKIWTSVLWMALWIIFWMIFKTFLRWIHIILAETADPARARRYTSAFKVAADAAHSSGDTPARDNRISGSIIVAAHCGSTL